jgi:hypothetical protein
LLDVTPYDGCMSIDNSTMNDKAIFMRFNNTFQCSLATILKNLEYNQARLAIIGSNGPIVGIYFRGFFFFINIFSVFFFLENKFVKY